MGTDNNIYKEAIITKSDATLTYVGKKISENNIREYECYEESNNNILMPEIVRGNIESMIRLEKERHNKKELHYRIKKYSLVASVIFSILLMSGVILVTNVEAFRYKFENFLVEVSSNSIKLAPSGTTDVEEIEIPKSWGNVRYPYYLPSGYIFEYAIEREGIKTLIFQNNENKYIKFSQRLAEGTQVYIDNEGEETGVMEIKKSYKGYWSKNEKHIVLTWMEEDIIFEVDSELNIDEIKKIADNTKNK